MIPNNKVPDAMSSIIRGMTQLQIVTLFHRLKSYPVCLLYTLISYGIPLSVAYFFIRHYFTIEITLTRKVKRESVVVVKQLDVKSSPGDTSRLTI